MAECCGLKRLTSKGNGAGELRLQVIVCRFVPIIALCLAGRAWADAGQPQNAVPISGTAATPLRVVIAGTPSEIGLKENWLGETTKADCVIFRATAFPSNSSFRLTTSGLGHVLLAISSDGSCPPPSPVWSQEITFGAQAGIESRTVGLTLDPKTEPPESGTLTGRIVAFDDHGEASSVALTVRPAGKSTVWQATLWFLGFGIPALAGFALGLAATRVQARIQAAADFNTFRVLNVTSIETLIDSLKTIMLSPTMEQPGRLAYEEAVKSGVLEKLPSRRKRYFIKLCYKNNIMGIKKMLCKTFPQQAKNFDHA